MDILMFPVPAMTLFTDCWLVYSMEMSEQFVQELPWKEYVPGGVL